jgi:hypothetical protein
MKNLNKTIKTYEALGFVEAMMAVMVIGISSVVLMQIAVNTMQNILQNEAIDDLTQYAIEGSEMIQEVANRDKVEEEVLFPLVAEYEGLLDNCFAFNLDGENIVLMKDDEENFVKFNPDDRDNYKDLAILNSSDEYFRIVCFDNPMGGAFGEPAFVHSQIIVGQRRSDGEITKGNVTKDYIYRTIVRL